MTLELTGGGVGLNSDKWLRVEANKIIGLIWDVDVPKKYQYTLIATDSGGLFVEYDIELTITTSVSNSTNQFNLTIKSVFIEFANDLDLQLDLYRKLQSVFGEGTVVRFSAVKQGSVIIEFSVRGQQTPKSDEVCGQVERFRDRVFSPPDTISNQLLESLNPFTVRKLTFAARKPCDDVVESMEGAIETPITDENRTSKPFNILYLVIPIVGALLLIVMIVIIVVCVKQRRKQKSLDVSQSNGTYIEKGVPVVFEEEMKDGVKREPHEREPLVDDDDMKPNPPAYPQNGKSENIPLNPKSGAGTYQPPTPPVSEYDD